VWHHRSVRCSYGLRLRIALCLFFLPPAIALSQATKQSKAKSDQVTARQGSGASSASRAPASDLEPLIRAQTNAVAGGDPVAIAAASRELNAQILVLLAQFRLAMGKRQEAIALYRESLDLEPSTRRRLEFASALLHSGDAAAAVTETDAIVAAEPDNAAAWMTRGSALRDAGRGPEAVQALTRALQLRPQPNVAFALGSTYLSLHDKAKAAAIFERVLEASGKSAIWYVAIGDAYRDAGYMDDAVANLKAALARDPRVLHGEFFLGLTYLQMNQWGPNSESFLHLRKAVLLSPHEYISNFYLGALESTDGSDLAASDRHLRAAAQADPTQPEVWLYLGMNANREKRIADAKMFLQKSIDLTGSDESRNNYQVRRAYFSLGRLLIAEGDRARGEALLARYKTAEQAAVAESGKSITQTEKPGTAESPLKSLVAATAPSAEPPGAQEEKTPEREVQIAAEEKLSKLLASSLNDLGTAEARQHEYTAALHSFQESEKWDPSNALVLRNLGVAAFRIKDSAEAVRALEAYRAKQVASGGTIDQNAQLMLALSQFSAGSFADAVNSFGAIAGLAMQDQRTAYSYAFALARIGHAQEANRIADDLAAQPLDADLLPLVCHIYIDTENYNGSQSCYRKALAQNANLPLAHYEIGESLIRLDRPAEAVPELRQELLVTPNDPNVLTALAFALLQISQKAEARSLLETAVKASPEHAQSQYELGKLLLEEGDVGNAIAHLERSEASDASKDYVHYQLATAYRKAARPEDAQRELRTYRKIKDSTRDANATPH
jgi:tetratricopeptide (TPR) repeat protein